MMISFFETKEDMGKHQFKNCIVIVHYHPLKLLRRAYHNFMYIICEFRCCIAYYFPFTDILISQPFALTSRLSS